MKYIIGDTFQYLVCTSIVSVKATGRKFSGLHLILSTYIVKNVIEFTESLMLIYSISLEANGKERILRRCSIMGKWDRGVPFEKALKDIVRHIKHVKNKLKYSTRYRKRLLKQLAHDYILLITLLNGTRASESIEAYEIWIRSGRREIEVKPRKKRDDDDEKRKIFIPNMIPDYDRHILKDIKVTKVSLSIYADRHYNFNPHTLRYAFITRFGRREGAAMAAKVTKHSKLKFILDYTQEREAELRHKIFIEEISERIKI